MHVKRWDHRKLRVVAVFLDNFELKINKINENLKMVDR